jgi:hypothetical protein
MLVTSALALAVPLLAVACGGNTESGDDPNRDQIVAFVETVTGAYASSGSQALHDYLSRDAAEKCALGELLNAFANEPQPGGASRVVKDIDVNGDSARVTVVIPTAEGDRDQAWTLVREQESWRIDDMPGLENCPR